LFTSNVFLAELIFFISTYGIPKGEWIKEEAQRAKLKLPLDVNDEKYGKQIVTYVEQMNNLDNHIWDNKDTIMGKHALKFKDPRTHQRIIKEGRIIEADSSDEDASDEEQQKTLPYMTVKLGMEWNEDGKCTGKLKVKTYRKEEVYDEDSGKKVTKREELFLNSIDELEALGVYRSTLRLIIIPSKFYLMPKSYEPKFGMIWKAVQLEIEPSRNNPSAGLSINQDLFADDDEGSETGAAIEQTAEPTTESDDEKELEDIPIKSKKKSKSKKAEI
jgi:hypothetical protein